jgi:hypothetical protein
VNHRTFLQARPKTTDNADMGDEYDKLLERLQYIARRIENVGLARAAEELRKLAEELKRHSHRATATARGRAAG